MDEIAKGVASNDNGIVSWYSHAPLHLEDAIEPVITEIDKFLLDHPDHRVTITIER